ncbi:hypothetical protein SS50377_22111 [Spironucleus salmonicida]|uniref:Uncharacterized protein n=1 Tax=Spironucleus salmonicida TaxID=348837 RepID=V6LY61_9EUKA|nr:hypothetical protein SS50377_22111 [Spironucleus salmonicida]|eukprot:EST45729.1 Hypothetical protein SS50377_14301 [Spironucleus salmonicida]
MKQSESQIRQLYYTYSLDLWKKAQLIEQQDKQYAYLQYKRSLEAMKIYISQTQFKVQSQALYDQMFIQFNIFTDQNGYSSQSATPIHSQSFQQDITNSLIKLNSPIQQAKTLLDNKNFIDAAKILQQQEQTEEVQLLLDEAKKNISIVQELKNQIQEEQKQIQSTNDQFTKVSHLRQIINLLNQIGNQKSLDLIPEVEKQISIESKGVPLI